MQVETYEVNEVGPGGAECEPEAVALIEKLGLDGQRSILRGDGAETCRIPYDRMSAEQRVVYSTLFSEQTPVEKYALGPIPVRVLQVVAHGKELFDHLEVWAPRTTAVPDPVLVGRIGNERYLLARWGSALVPYSDLVERAKAMIRDRVIAKARTNAAEAQAALAAPDMEVLKILNGSWTMYG